MEIFFTLIAIFHKIWSVIIKLFKFILKKFGYKVVPNDDYKEEELEVNIDFPSKSPECIEENKAGAKFYWSEKYHLNYDKFFILRGNVRSYFKSGKQYLWIKRP